MRLNDFIYTTGQKINDDNRNLTIIKEHISCNEKYRTKAYKCKCNVCGYISIKTESDILRGRGCPCCSSRIVVEGINDIPTTDPWMIPYFQGGYEEAKQYTRQSNKKIRPICPNCGMISNKDVRIYSIFNNHSFGCYCGDGRSYPNKFMYSLLIQLNYEFIDEYSPDWIKPKRYDFYIPSRNLIIEMDGALGHGNRVFQNSKRTPEETLKVDNYKNDMVLKHEINIVRIDCKKSDINYISKNIVGSGIFNHEEIKKVSFEKCDEFATSNFAKYVCQYYSQKEYGTAKNVSKDLNISCKAALRYLKQGNKYGWCKYEPKRMHSIGIQKSMQDRYYVGNKKYFVYNSCGDLLGTYFTIKEITIDLTKRFGKNTNQSSITAALKRKNHKYKDWFIFQNKKEIDDFLYNLSYKNNLRKICCYDIYGNFIKNFDSVSEIVKELGISDTSVYKILNRKPGAKTTHGYIFRYSNDCEDIKQGTYSKNDKKRNIIQYDYNYNMIKKYESLTMAYKETNVNKSSICMVCNGKRKFAGGFIWRYADEVENNTLGMVI